MPGLVYQNSRRDFHSDSDDPESTGSSEDDVPVSRGVTNRRRIRTANAIDQDGDDSEVWLSLRSLNTFVM